MGNIGNIIVDGGMPAYIIVLLGIAALALIVERVKVLYFDYNIKTTEFMKQVTSLVRNDQVEEAITFCAANEKSPLAHTIKGVLERSDREDEGIHQGLDIALTEVIPNLGKRLGYLSMLANVATLLGLLGTISGLILAFSAVGDADPSQKQLILAQGISMAMYTTALGLSVAIPVLMAYSFLHSRQNHLLEEISEHASKVVDLLTTRHYQPFTAATAFPKDLRQAEISKKAKNQPPSANAKAA